MRRAAAMFLCARLFLQCRRPKIARGEAALTRSRLSRKSAPAASTKRAVSRRLGRRLFARAARKTVSKASASRRSRPSHAAASHANPRQHPHPNAQFPADSAGVYSPEPRSNLFPKRPRPGEAALTRSRLSHKSAPAASTKRAIFCRLGRRLFARAALNTDSKASASR